MPKREPLGYLSLVLHAHLPFVRHPEFDEPLEEDWLHEAITETYIPILRMMDGLTRDGVDWRLTMSLTPPLVSMLADTLVKEVKGNVLVCDMAITNDKGVDCVKGTAEIPATA